MKIQNNQIKNLLADYKTIWSIEYATKLIGWDLNTYLPKGASQNHGVALGKFAVLRKQKLLSKGFLQKLNDCNKQKDLNDAEKGILRVLNKEVEENKKLPTEFLEEWSNTTTNSQNAWEKAKITNDYSKFEPFLQKIIDLNLQKAEYLGYNDHPYDALLDLYEEGSTQKQVTDYFNKVKPVALDLLTYIKNSKNYKDTHKLETTPYNKSKAAKLNEYILQEIFGESVENLRLDISTHPFTQGFSSKQARITTWYHKADINRSIAATIHEFGHALYELQTSSSLDYTPIAGGISLGIHESQSRFWENMVGRNKAFINVLLDKINKALQSPTDIQNYFNYANMVKPGLIRVEADEVTYHMHILIRFEMEKALLEKKISAKDAPDAWNEMYKKYLGVSANKYSEGILQDIHWSMGAIGYFPTYSTGTVLSATWKDMLEKELGSLDNLVTTPKGIKQIKEWQKEHIHKYGSTYTFNQLVKKQTGQEFTVDPWGIYLNNKYKSLY